MNPTTLLLGLALMTHSSGGAGNAYQETSERTLAAGGIRSLAVENARGRITVRPSADGRIHVTAIKLCRAENRSRSMDYARQTSVEAGPEGDRYRIKVKYPKRVDVRVSFWDLFKEESWENGSMLPRVEVRLAIDVPAGIPVRLETVSGDIETAGLAGTQALRATSGDVTVSGARGEVDARTVSGDVDCDSLASRLAVQTTSGDVMVGLVRGPAQVGTVSGDVVVSEASDSVRVSSTSGDLSITDAPKGLDARTVSGEVQVRGAAGRVQVKTSSGGVRIRLRGPLAAADLETVSGEMRVDLAKGMDATLTLRSVSGALNASVGLTNLATGRNEMSGQYGRGGPAIRLKSSSGSIHVTSGGK